MRLQKLGLQPALGLAWFLVAALPCAGGWQISGPFGGSARSIAVDPQHGNTLVAGSRDSLLFRSGDAGASWQLLAFPKGAPGVFNALIIDPQQSGHYYAGLDAGDSPDSGVYESRDSGESWLQQPDLRGLRIESLAMWPQDPRILAAGTSQGVFLTADAGATWRRISAAGDAEMQEITALAFDPTDSKVIYAGTPHLPWKTLDGGESWRSIHTGLIDDSDIFSIKVDPAHPQLVFASACSGIYRSDTGGGAWVKIQGIPGTHRRTHIIAEDPGSAGAIYAGTTLGLFKSADGGKTWRHLTFEQVNWMVFDPADSRILYLATEHAGILKSSDSGETFRPSNQGFANHRLSEITAAGNQLYASSSYEGRYGGVFASKDGGLHWSLRANEDVLLGRNLNGLAAVASGKGVLFASSEDAVLKSPDGGATWSVLPAQPRVAPPRPQSAARIRIHALRAVQAGRPLLLAGTDAGLFRSFDSGATWEQVRSAGISGTPVLAMYAPPRGASRLALETRAGLFLSADSGRSWQLAPLPDSSYYIYDVALPVDREAPLLAATSRGVLRSDDDGAHWALVTNGLPAGTVNSVRFHPEEKLEAFLVQFGKIYRTLDGGASWAPFPSDGLHNSSIRMLWFAPDLPGRIFALSAARGALVFDLPQPPLAKQDDHVVVSSSQ